MNSWRALPLKAGQLALRLRVRPGAIREQLRRERPVIAPPPDGRQVRLGVVQLAGRLYRRASDYAAHLSDLTRRAVADGAQLLVFPEDTGIYPLAGLIPGIERLLASRGESGDQAVRTGAAPVLDLLRLLAPAARSIYQVVFSTLAQSCGVHILAGSTVALDAAGRVYKEAHLYGPDGGLLLAQRKTHLFPTEALWGLSRDDLVHVAKTPLGVLASPICMDHTYFEPIRVAWLKRAEIILDPAADAARYSFWKQARGVWARVQESPAYGVHALMVGHILGQVFGGRSGVYAPLPITPHQDGIVVQAKTGDSEEVFCATVDLEALRTYRREHRPAFNLALYNRYLPAVYSAHVLDREALLDRRRNVA